MANLSELEIRVLQEAVEMAKRGEPVIAAEGWDVKDFVRGLVAAQFQQAMEDRQLLLDYIITLVDTEGVMENKMPEKIRRMVERAAGFE